VAPDETVLARGMDVGGLVGALMMQAMMRRPPERPALHAGRAHNRKTELREARGLERAMRKIAVIKSGNREHPDEVERDRDSDCHRTPSHPDYSEAHQMDRDERDASKPVGLLWTVG
jgi:hypothetical protein